MFLVVSETTQAVFTKSRDIVDGELDVLTSSLHFLLLHRRPDIGLQHRSSPQRGSGAGEREPFFGSGRQGIAR